jgi:hypothetical protein
MFPGLPMYPLVSKHASWKSLFSMEVLMDKMEDFPFAMFDYLRVTI